MQEADQSLYAWIMQQLLPFLLYTVLSAATVSKMTMIKGSYRINKSVLLQMYKCSWWKILFCCRKAHTYSWLAWMMWRYLLPARIQWQVIGIGGFSRLQTLDQASMYYMCKQPSSNMCMLVFLFCLHGIADKNQLVDVKPTWQCCNIGSDHEDITKETYGLLFLYYDIYLSHTTNCQAVSDMMMYMKGSIYLCNLRSQYDCASYTAI